jgi:hypothetical protein
VTARRSGRSHLLTAQCRTDSCCTGARSTVHRCTVHVAQCMVHVNGIARPHLLPSSSTLTVSSHWSCTACNHDGPQVCRCSADGTQQPAATTAGAMAHRACGVI